MSAVDGEPSGETPKTELVANASKPVASPPITQSDTSTATREREVKTAEKLPPETAVAQNDKPVYVPSAPPTDREESKKDEPKSVAIVPSSNGDSPSIIDVGSLLAYATKQAPAIYPTAAKTARQTGLVKVEVTVDENGEVANVQKATGPIMLQGAAKDAIKKWKFKPFVRDGQPVKATGFVSFNFSM